MRVYQAVGLCLVVALGTACATGDGPPQGEPPVEPSPVPPVPPEPVQREVPDTLFQAVERDPDDAAAHRSLAIALHGARRRLEAIPHFERAAEREPSARHLLDLALAQSSVSLNAEAEATYRRLLETAPGDPVALHNLGNLELTRGRPEKAIELYREAIAANPNYLLAYYHLADALEQTGSYREAFQTFEEVLQIEPATPQELETFDNALYRMAMLDLMMGAHQRAAEFLATLVEQNPEHPNAHYAYGRALMLLGRTQKAQRAFETHMRLLAQREPTGPVATNE